MRVENLVCMQLMYSLKDLFKTIISGNIYKCYGLIDFFLYFMNGIADLRSMAATKLH